MSRVEDGWLLNKKKAEVLNIQFDLGKSLVQGNKNQIGRKAWSAMLERIANDVFDYINHSFSIKKNVQNLKAKILESHAKKGNSAEPLGSLERQYHKNCGMLKNMLFETVDVKDFPPYYLEKILQLHYTQ